MSEWLGSGLQHHIREFESLSELECKLGLYVSWLDGYTHNEEVACSIHAKPTWNEI